MKLNQVLATEKSVKSAVMTELTRAHHESQKPGLFDGQERRYEPAREDGRTFPSESVKVQRSAKLMFHEIVTHLTELFDTVATKDWANCSAKSDIVVDGEVLVKGAPSTYLLFLDKQFTDLHTFLSKFVELDPSLEWETDPNMDLFKSKPAASIKTEKVQEPLTLSPATDRHPAQVQLITKDVIVGTWYTTKFSGALPSSRKKELIDRVQKLSRAVKVALEHANTVEAEKQYVGAPLLKYLFK